MKLLQLNVNDTKIALKDMTVGQVGVSELDYIYARLPYAAICLNRPEYSILEFINTSHTKVKILPEGTTILLKV